MEYYMGTVIFQDVQQFINKLDKTSSAKVYRAMSKLKEYGSLLTMPLSKHINDGIFELRTRGNPEVRILYCFYQYKIVLLLAFIKKSNKMPKNLLTQAKKRRKLLTDYNL